MAQGKGALMQLLYQRETTFRTAPGSPDAVRLPFTSYNVGRDPKKVRDNSINASPLPGKMSCGDAEVAGNIKSILDLRGIGYWMALLLGVPSAKKAVTKQPTNVTGVTVNYAHATCTAGAGTLTYTNTGKTLAWQAQGDSTAGTPVDVTAGGYFTLESDTADHSIHVTVAAGALPSTDKSDADIAVSATLKTHLFPVDLNDRPSALLELGHSDLSKFYRADGVKLNSLAYDLTAAEQDISMDVLAGAETEYGTTWDATPTSFDSVRACGSGGRISNGSNTALGTVVSGDISVNNGMQGYLLPDGLEGYGLIDQGEISIKGKVKTVFDAAGAYALSRADTSTRLRLTSNAAVGSDVFSLVWDIPNVSFAEKAPPKEGKSGLFVELDWEAHRDAAGNLPLVMLTNDVTAY
jgi:hypothetical protein